MTPDLMDLAHRIADALRAMPDVKAVDVSHTDSSLLVDFEDGGTVTVDVYET